jgi:hypothetical protein
MFLDRHQGGTCSGAWLVLSHTALPCEICQCTDFLCVISFVKVAERSFYCIDFLWLANRTFCGLAIFFGAAGRFQKKKKRRSGRYCIQTPTPLLSPTPWDRVPPAGSASAAASLAGARYWHTPVGSWILQLRAEQSNRPGSQAQHPSKSRQNHPINNQQAATAAASSKRQKGRAAATKALSGPPHIARTC